MGKTNETTYLAGDWIPVFVCDQCEKNTDGFGLYWENKDFSLCGSCLEANYNDLFQVERFKVRSAETKKAIPDRMRREMLERDGHQCRYCDSTEDLTADHIIPVSRGGPTTIENLATACRPCNSRKGARTPEEANMKLKRV